MSAPEKKQHLHWSYDERDHCGPHNWSSLFQAGPLQSPINILLQQPSDTCCAGRLRESLWRFWRREKSGARSPPAGFGSSLDSVSSSSALSSPARSTPTQASGSDYFDEEEPEEAAKSRGPAEVQNTRLCATTRKIFLGYPRYLHQARLENTGHGWQVSLPPELARHTLLNGPPLADREYRLLQFHAHWGEDCAAGSEHQLDGRSFSAELHFVHWNCSDFATAEEAAKHKHGLAVLGVLVQALEGESNKNKHLEKIVANLKSVQRAGSAADIPHFRLDLKKLFPANRWQYATYEGSLTTPPLSEVVDWVLFLNPIHCSTGQLDEFRKLSAGGPDKPLRKNCRPVQPSNQRQVSIWGHKLKQ